ncbi:MAG: TetR/AcrR family transcriptional regulator [Planctomycetota bacterium]
MPRRDLTEERTAQILDAFERCIVREGLGATSLEDIAQEADVKRSILRHYVGNRDDLVRALTDRLLAHYRADLAETRSYATAGGARVVDRLLECLFPPPSEESFQSVIVLEALIVAARQDDDLRLRIRELMADTVECVVAVLRHALEGARVDRKDLFAVAWAVVGLSFNEESLTPLALPARYRRGSVQAARALIESLTG